MVSIQRVCSPTVRIIAFQAIDPGSTPGKRKKFSFFWFFLSLFWQNENSIMVAVGFEPTRTYVQKILSLPP